MAKHWLFRHLMKRLVFLRLVPRALCLKQEKRMPNYQLITHENAKSPVAEAYRTFRTNLQFANAGEALSTLMYTSAGPGEGKSTTVANTAIVLAQNGKRVIVVDCDLRKPVQHKIFGLAKQGVTNALVENRSPQELLQKTAVNNLQVLASGPIPPNPSEMLGSGKMAQLFQELSEECDLLLIDAPPVVAVTDACVLASKVDGVVMVISSGMDRPEIAQHAKELLVKARGRILGVVLNRVAIDKEHAHYYYYYGNDGGKRREG
jgi:capsular exopolysaccharide synthesis family protein